MIFLNTYKKSALTLFLFIIVFDLKGQNSPPLISKTKLDNYISTFVLSSGESFKWDEHSDTLMYNALIKHDSLVSIGILPAGISSEDLFSGESFSSSDWFNARNEILDLIIRHSGDLTLDYLFPFGQNRNRPYITARINSWELLLKIKSHISVRYVSPMTYVFDEQIRKSTSGCSEVTDPISSADTISTSPQSVVSWTNVEHNIETAWTNSEKGKEINIAVLDTGLSPTQSKLNEDFNEGESVGRSLVKKGFYAPSPGAPYDGWQDQCGHGTAMSGLAAAPKGFDNTPCGAAYLSNLISYRCVEDVIINTATEKEGVSESLFHAADTTVHIVSMSLGDIIYNEQVADAIKYAESAGVLICAATGTSTSFTNGFGVIFPADMNETLAITGVKDSGPPFERCESCHDGTANDFVVFMERENQTSRHAVTLGEPDLDLTYVGGSSCATSTFAGHAAVLWSTYPSWNKSQVVSRLIESANYFPNRNSDHGWGAVDIGYALSIEDFGPCDSNIKNDTWLEVTNITFPSTSDGLFNNTAEWVIEINGYAFYFEVDVDGDSGEPNSFLENDVCGFYPMVINLGENTCGSNSIPSFILSTHEDDGGSSDCDYNSLFDDDFNSSNINLTFSGTSFSSNGFAFDYNLYCVPQNIPSFSMAGDSILCFEDSSKELTIDINNGIAPYSVSYSLNNLPNNSFQTNSSGVFNLIIPTDNALNNVISFNSITDNDGCSYIINEQFSFFVNPPNYSDGSYGPLNGNVVQYYGETDGILDSRQIILQGGSVIYDSGIEINLLDGFEVKIGALFETLIDGCNDNPYGN